MTRDFSKQRRDDTRPSSRNSSSGRYGEERSPRPARPRLNREAVDRAWENGAPQNHADYRGRNNNNRNAQPPRDSRRRDSQFDQPSAQYSRNRPNRPNNYGGHNSSRPFSNRQDDHRRSEGAPYGNSNPRYRSTDYSAGDTGSSRFNDRRGQGAINRAPTDRSGSYRGSRDNARYRDSGDQYHDRSADRGYEHQGRNFDRDNRYPRDFDRDNRSPRNFDRDGRTPRDFDRDNRPPRNFSQGNRPSPSRGVRRPDTQNPRFQSRPPMQRGNAYSGPERDFPRHRPQEEQFEGDYERFDAPVGADVSRPAPIERPLAPQHPSTTDRFQDNPSDQRDQVANEPPDRTVTRLPDGRVLKGPRPVQRKNAQFWNEIADETEALVDSVHTPPTEQPVHLPEAAPAKQVKPKAPSKPSSPRTPGKRAASAVARERKAETRKTGTKKGIAKARSTGPKPSQRGYKWPTP